MIRINEFSLMKAPLVLLAALFVLSLRIDAQTADQGQEPRDGAKVESRSFVLAGYLPDFYEPIDVDDPFAPGAAQKPFQIREDPAVSYLRAMGLKAKSIHFVKEHNGLILEGTSEELEQAEFLLRRMFGPDMQLKAIDHAQQALSDKNLFAGERLEQIGILDQVTMRAFHSEARRLESVLEDLPEGHKDREEVRRQLNLARQCRDEALQLCREGLKKQRELVAKWKKEIGKPLEPGSGK
jgi:hypothetical protein